MKAENYEAAQALAAIAAASRADMEPSTALLDKLVHDYVERMERLLVPIGQPLRASRAFGAGKPISKRTAQRSKKYKRYGHEIELELVPCGTDGTGPRGVGACIGCDWEHWRRKPGAMPTRSR